MKEQKKTGMPEGDGTRIIRGLWQIPAVKQFGLAALRAAAGFCLTHAAVFDVNAPFGVAWLAAVGGGAAGILTLIGVLAGYAAMAGRVDSVGYIAVAILVFTAQTFFKNTSLGKRPSFIPTLTAGVGGFVGLVFLLGDGINPISAVLFAMDVVLMSGMCYFYRLALLPETADGRFKRSLSMLVLVSTLFLSLSSLSIAEVVYPARIAAGIYVLYRAWQSGMGAGASTGLTVGLALDFGIGYPFFSMLYGLSGLLSGIFKRTGKLVMVVVFIVSGGIAALWAGTESLRLSVLLETFCASVLFMLMPFKTGAREMVLDEESCLRHDIGRQTQNYAKRRLHGASSSFRELYNSLSGVFDRDGRKNDGDMAAVFDRTAEKVCRHCKMRGDCWDHHNSATTHALSDASGKFLKNYKARAEDFNGYFSSRCVQFPKFLSVTNEELDALLKRKQSRSRLLENRKLVSRQYAEMSRILDDVADEVGQGIVFDEDAEGRVNRFLESQRISAAASVYTDLTGRRRVEIMGEALNGLMQDSVFLRELSDRAGYALTFPLERHTPGGECLIFPEAELLDAVIGAVSHKKRGESVSGDCGSWFKTEKGRVYMILADGMGSGKEAARDSAQACTLLERFLKAGISPEISLEMLNSSLILKSDVETALVTVDLLTVDLFSGEAKLFKHGASATYIRRGPHVQRVTSRSLPAGARVSQAEVTPFILKKGDVLLLISDGIAGADDDQWLREGLLAYEGTSPRELSEKVLESAILHHGRGDDMMVLTLLLPE